ncbi:hypothetical protein BDN70DRAFT_638392 [Pholiota conissans]|uniref:Uncharacterized protein n=1 Tax=Pholiota conissans TaxID=109636 RepID=A0A9P5ZDE6_9AGAR|nr:hypothetical protein BDN70DRAFT_638392 [Pholiota conissans]
MTILRIRNRRRGVNMSVVLAIWRGRIGGVMMLRRLSLICVPNLSISFFLAPGIYSTPTFPNRTRRGFRRISQTFWFLSWCFLDPLIHLIIPSLSQTFPY